MGNAYDIKKDMAKTGPCRKCGSSVFLARINWRVVPPHISGRPDDEALDLVSMPTRFTMILDREPNDRGAYVLNDGANATNDAYARGFVAYDPELSLDHTMWGFVRYRGHDCPRNPSARRDRGIANRIFRDGLVIPREAVGS